jgi:hypothetical protein
MVIAYGMMTCKKCGKWGNWYDGWCPYCGCSDGEYDE